MNKDAGRNIGKNIGALRKVISHHISKKRHPLAVTFVITYRCNLRCSYCNMWNIKDREMTAEEIFSMVDQFANMGTRRFGITGGEPLLRPDIKEIIDYAKGKEMIVTLQTNGWLVKDNISKLKNLDLLLLSFDGPPEVHDLNRQKGSHDKVIEAIKTARKNNIKIWANTTITKFNLGHINYILDTAMSLGFKLLFQPVMYYPLASAGKEQIDAISPPIEEYQDFICKLMKKRKEKNSPILNSSTYLRFIMNLNRKRTFKECFAGKLYVAVSPSGNVAPCFFLVERQGWLNGKEHGFKKAVSGMPRFACQGCFCSAVNESDYFYRFNPEVVYNMLTKFL